MHEKPGHQNGREGKAEEHYRFGALRFAQARELRPDSDHHRSRSENCQNKDRAPAFLFQASLLPYAVNLTPEHHDAQKRDVKPSRRVPSG